MLRGENTETKENAPLKPENAENQEKKINNCTQRDDS